MDKESMKFIIEMAFPLILLVHSFIIIRNTDKLIKEGRQWEDADIWHCH